MKKIIISVLSVLLISVLCPIIYTYFDVPQISENIRTFSLQDDGTVTIAFDEDGRLRLLQINAEGNICRNDVLSSGKNTQTRILDAASYDGKLYFLEATYANFAVTEQKVVCYAEGKNPQTLMLLDKEKEGPVQTIDISDGHMFISGVSDDKKTAQVNKYVFTSEGQPVFTESISYKTESINSEDFQKIRYYDSLAIVMTKQGNLYQIKDMQKPKKFYRYTQFFHFDNELNVISKDVFTGELTKTNMYSLAFTIIGQDGTQVAQGGNGSLVFDNIVDVAYQNEKSFVAIFKDDENSKMHLVLFKNGNAIDLSNYKLPLDMAVYQSLKNILICFVAGMALLMVIIGISRLFRQSKRFLAKLLAGTGILLLAALAVTGVFVYFLYGNTLIQNAYGRAEQINQNLLRRLDAADTYGIQMQEDYSLPQVKRLKELFSNMQIQGGGSYSNSYILLANGDGIYTGIGDFMPFYNRLDNYFTKSEINAFYEAYKNNQTTYAPMINLYGKQLACITPVTYNGNVSALLVTELSKSSVLNELNDYVFDYIKLAIALFGVLMGISALGGWRMLSTLRELHKAAVSFTSAGQVIPVKYSTFDEFLDISIVFNNITGLLESLNYELKSVIENYGKFFPKRMVESVGKKSMTELQPKDTILINAVCAKIQLNNFDALLGKLGEKQTLDIASEFFTYVNQEADKCGALLLADSSDMSAFTLIFVKQDFQALSVAQNIVEHIRSYNIKHPEDVMDVLVLLHKQNVLFGLGGDSTRYTPIMFSEDNIFSKRVFEYFRTLGCGLVASEEAVSAAGDISAYYYRKAGYINHNGERITYYDFYDNGSKEAINFKETTKSDFEEAIKLFNEKQFYAAKARFAAVVKQNPQDYLAKMYLFKCDRIQQAKDEEYELNIF